MKYHRTTHIPITAVANGAQLELMVDRADSTYLREDCSFNRLLPRYREVTITTANEYNPISLALEYWGRAELYWLVGAYNGMWSPTTQMAAGTVVRIPERDDVERYIDRLVERGPRSVGGGNSNLTSVSGRTIL